ncbi:hypothetical protein TorRG33x02_263200 [Trema orientale]|uniref:Uncharacterized protein n=1 Tax=Trema orientale TaxID=63057 RepID=A0A2P5D3X6_TREOI|nr:hypothetical protein TorRG33x02_263200 [Trema orientale]
MEIDRTTRDHSECRHWPEKPDVLNDEQYLTLDVGSGFLDEIVDKKYRTDDSSAEQYGLHGHRLFQIALFALL